MGRDQFTFYRSFLDGISRIRNKEERCDAYDAIVNYALCELEPDLDKLSDIVALAFIMVKPVLDSGRKKAEAGKKGGSSETKSTIKQISSKEKAKGKQTESNEEATAKLDRDRVRDRDIDRVIDRDIYKAQKRFTPPTISEVEEYAREKGYSVDAEKFVAYYESKGWLVGKSPMKNWKAAVVTWSKNNFEHPNKATSSNGFLDILRDMEAEQGEVIVSEQDGNGESSFGFASGLP